MGTAPLPVNQAADVLNQVIGILMKDGEKAAEAFLTSLDPALLSIPIVQWIMDEGVQYLGQIVSVAGQHFATAVVVDIQINGEKSNVINSGTAFQLALASGNADAIKSAGDTLAAAYAKLIHFDGIATPH